MLPKPGGHGASLANFAANFDTESSLASKIASAQLLITSKNKAATTCSFSYQCCLCSYETFLPCTE
jgi:hypothetical protein